MQKRFKKSGSLGVCFAFLVLFAGLCTACGGRTKPPFEYMPHMMDSPALKAQKWPMRLPVEGTTPIHFERYPYTKDQGDLAAKRLVNPLTQCLQGRLTPPALGPGLKVAEATPLETVPCVESYASGKEIFLRGRKVFNTYCIVCHGERGKGDGLIVPKFPRPPSLLSDKVREWSDGRIYHVITMGQNLMPSYSTQIGPEDRWAIVEYVRVLQRATRPTREDVEALKKMLKEGSIP